jgi:hypothetical protein
MPYWTTLCVLRMTCRQSGLYKSLFPLNTLSKHHHHHIREEQYGIQWDYGRERRSVCTSDEYGRGL